MQELINRFTTQLHTKLILILLSSHKRFKKIFIALQLNLQNLYFFYFKTIVFKLTFFNAMNVYYSF